MVSVTHVIDEQGRLFGYVNVIDAMALLVLLAVVAGAVFLVLGPSGVAASQDPVTVTTTVEVQRPIGHEVAVQNRQMLDDDVLEVERTAEAEIRSRTDPETGNIDRIAVHRFSVRLSATQDGNSRLYFRGERLVVGRSVAIDMGTIILEGQVVDITAVQEVDRDE